MVVLGVRSAAAENASEARMRRDIDYLASDECEGRGVTTKGINLAADYIAHEFKKAGLKPAGADNTYFQPFTMTGTARLENPNRLTLRGPLGQQIELKLGEHYQPMALGGSGQVTAPVVFAGFGAVAPGIGYDDYKDVDVAGKVVVILRKTPRADNTQAPFDGEQSAHHAGLETKLVQAHLQKAAALVLVNDLDTARNEDRLIDFRDFRYASGKGAQLPAVHARRDVIDPILRASLGAGLRELEQDISRDLKPRSRALEGWTAAVEVTVVRPKIPVKNVIGVLEGTGPLAKETVVLGAHYDHLGFGGRGSLARNLNKPAIHHGADDNASGTTGLLELARRFGQKSTREGRRLVFIAFSGEEDGLLGSAHYCNNPVFPLTDTVTMVNLDMVGRLRPVKDGDAMKDKLIVYGTGTSKTFDELIDGLNRKYDFKLQKVPGGSGPSDHASFYAKQIPVFFFFTDNHPDYHRPSDTAEKINLVGLRRITDLVEELTDHLATVPERPHYVRVASSGSSPGRMRGPRLGIQPSYGDDKEGVLLDAVVEGGAAAKAGLKGGDRIVEIAGKPVQNLESYMVLIAASYKKGEPLELGIQREGKKLNVKVMLD
jgi:hypothetical protein